MTNPPAIPPIPVPPSIPPVPAKGGAGKWVLLGCGGCLGLLLLGGAAVAGIFFFVFGALKKSEVYAESVKRAQQSTEVQQALGIPVETGWMLQGSLNTVNGDGTADFTIPLQGPHGEATLRVKASKAAGGAWQYSEMQATLPDASTVDLRDNPSPLPPVE